MTGVALKPADDLRPTAGLIVEDIRARLAALVPGLEVHHVGATAMPAAVTKGDVDVVVRVSSAQFSALVEALKPSFTEKQRENWTPEFASFGDESSYALPVGVQVVGRPWAEATVLAAMSEIERGASEDEGYPHTPVP